MAKRRLSCWFDVPIFVSDAALCVVFQPVPTNTYVRSTTRQYSKADANILKCRVHGKIREKSSRNTIHIIHENIERSICMCLRSTHYSVYRLNSPSDSPHNRSPCSLPFLNFFRCLINYALIDSIYRKKFAGQNNWMCYMLYMYVICTIHEMPIEYSRSALRARQTNQEGTVNKSENEMECSHSD